MPLADLQRPAFCPYYKGGKRIHLAVAEAAEDVGSAASRWVTRWRGGGGRAWAATGSSCVAAP